MAIPCHTREEVEAMRVEPMSEDGKCEKCGLEITTGLMAGLCQYSTDCPMWPTSDGTPAGDGGELFMAHVWMEQANKQLRIQIDDRARLEREIAALREAAKRGAEVIANYIKMDCGCDHSTGICMCAEIRVAEELQRLSEGHAQNSL